MDSRVARVFAYAVGAKTWLPVLWLDRAGHGVTFKWERTTEGITAGTRSMTKVTVLNPRSRGVVVRWVDPGIGIWSWDLCRVDSLGIRAPSVLVKGYGGSAFAKPRERGLPDPDHLWIFDPTNAGSACRPTELMIGPSGAMPQLDGSDPGDSPTAAQAAPLKDGGPDLPSRIWRFTYDDRLAKMQTITDPEGVVTSWPCTVIVDTSAPVRSGNAANVVLMNDASGRTWMTAAGPGAQVSNSWDSPAIHSLVQGDCMRSIAPGGFMVYKIVCRGQVTFVTTNQMEAEAEFERRRDHGTETHGTSVKCEIVQMWVSGAGSTDGRNGDPASGQAAGWEQRNREIALRAYQVDVRQAIDSWLEQGSAKAMLKAYWEAPSTQPEIVKVGSWTTSATNEALVKMGLKGISSSISTTILGFNAVWAYLDGLTGVENHSIKINDELKIKLERASSKYWETVNAK